MLLSQNWIKYVEDNKLKLLMIVSREDLFDFLKGLNLYHFKFKIAEGLREMDGPIGNFPSFHLSYTIGETDDSISIEVGPDFMPIVVIENDKTKPLESRTVEFSEYFKISELESHDLDAFFTEFGNSLLARN